MGLLLSRRSWPRSPRSSALGSSWAQPLASALSWFLQAHSSTGVSSSCLGAGGIRSLLCAWPFGRRPPAIPRRLERVCSMIADGKVCSTSRMAHLIIRANDVVVVLLVGELCDFLNTAGHQRKINGHAHASTLQSQRAHQMSVFSINSMLVIVSLAG